MANYATLTVPVKDIVGDGYDTSQASVWIEANTPRSLLVVDGTTIHVGGRRKTPDANGNVTFEDLVTTDSADNPTTFGYRVRIVHTPRGSRKRDPDEVVTADFPLTADANLAAIEEAWDDIVVPVEWRSEFRTEMEQLRDEQRSLAEIDTPDALVTNLFQTDGTALNTAAKATIATDITHKGTPATPLGSSGFAVRYVDRGHGFLGFDETGAMIGTLPMSPGGLTLGRSTDDGETWTTVGVPDATNAPAGFWVTAADTWLVYSNSGKLFRSTNQGGTWTLVATTGTILNAGLTQEPDGTLWAAEYLGAARVWRSTDDGVTWAEHYNFPNTDDGSGTVIRHIHGIKSLPSGLWVYTGDNNTQCGLWRYDGGTFVRKSPSVIDPDAQRWRAVDLTERDGWLYWVQDGASPAGAQPAIVKADPDDLANTLTVLAEVPTGGWYLAHTSAGGLLVGSVNEGVGKEKDRATRLWHIDGNDRVSEVWSAAPAASGLSVEFLAVRNLAVRQSDGLVAFTVNQTDFTGPGSTAAATVVGEVTTGGKPAVMSREGTPAAYDDTRRMWVARGVTYGPYTTDTATWTAIPEMEVEVSTRTKAPLMVTLCMDARVNTDQMFVRLVAVTVAGGYVTIAERRWAQTTYGVLTISEVFVPPFVGDYTIKAEWISSGSAVAESGFASRTLIVHQP